MVKKQQNRHIVIEFISIFAVVGSLTTRLNLKIYTSCDQKTKNFMIWLSLD